MPNNKISIIDSHTGGEPTRAVVDGFPDLGGGTIKSRMDVLAKHHDQYRSAVINEPRGHSAIVGALILTPNDKENDAGVLFFNNAGYLGMCGHGTIGIVKTLEYLGKTDSDIVRLETVAGNVEARINEDGSVSVQNVRSFRYKKDIAVRLQSGVQVRGDIAWGGNWFFLVKDNDLEITMGNLRNLQSFSAEVMESLAQKGITGADHHKIDHIELFSDSDSADSKNFVLCPGGDYDRSPCGTGTSAKIACLAADGLLRDDEIWTQESITGSMFEASYKQVDGGIMPTITGSAFITAESRLIFDSRDPFRFGIEQ